MASFKITESGYFLKGGFKLNMQGIRPTSAQAKEGVVNISNLDLTQLELGKMLGRGASAAVYIAVHKASRLTIALKKLGIHSQEKRQMLVSELKVSLSQPVCYSYPPLAYANDRRWSGLRLRTL